MKLGKYQHSKTGKMYHVIAVAKHSETLEDLVVYEALYDNPTSKIWVRPMKMFLENVEIDGKSVPRFKYIGNK
jgi:cyclomaltodextrinase